MNTKRTVKLTTTLTDEEARKIVSSVFGAKCFDKERDKCLLQFARKLRDLGRF